MIFSRSWRALMRRNLIYRKRKIIGSIFELFLPVLFVGILVLIKNSAEDNDNFKPRTIEATFPTNDDAMKILSFTDYVTALQAQRICTREPVRFFDVLMGKLEALVNEGEINIFEYLPAYLALQEELRKRNEERLKNASDSANVTNTITGNDAIEASNNIINSTDMSNRIFNITGMNNSSTGTNGVGIGMDMGMDVDLDLDMDIIEEFLLDILTNDPNLAGVVEEAREETTRFFSITGIPNQGNNWQVPFVKCDSRLCKEDYQNAAKSFCDYPILALAPNEENDGIAIDRVEAFQAYIFDNYPQLKNENEELSFEHDFLKTFVSNEDIENYVKDDDYGLVQDKPKIGLAILFSGYDRDEYKYTIRANATNFNAPEEEARPGSVTSPDTTRQLNSYARSDYSCYAQGGTPYQGRYRHSCTGQYMYNGVLTIQRLVHDFIIEDSGAKEQGYFVSEHGVIYLPFPSPSFELSGFLAVLAEFAPLFIILGLLYPVASMVSFIVSEKELRQKELMKMMSVDESDLEWSWFCSFFIFHLVSMTLTAIVSMELFENSSKILLWLFWFLAFTSLIVFSQFLATLSSKSTRGVLIGLLVFFGGYILINVVRSDTGSLMNIRMVCLHPAATISYLLQEIARLEDSGAGITIDTMFVSDNPSGFSFMTGINSFIFDIFFWGLISWYVNRVLVTSEYGQSLPLNFPFKMSYWCPGREKTPLQADRINMEPAKYDDKIPVEEVSDVLRSQAEKGESIEVHELRKSFKDKTAVDGLNLSIYSGQITALLGHNGAGKSTTINLLSGALVPTSGSATITGRDVTTDSNEIRKNIGICLQHDCLFPQLTVKEHVQFFCRLKGVYSELPYEEAEEQVDNAIKDVSLLEKKHTLSKNLSGGMKRKLSVAMAFCGNSKVVFLDEPTSGMDPFSRRFTWNIIRKYRQKRCIILTTHFMDEADVLGDRIAIMSEGRLCCVGSSFFLKKTYGVGYQLTIDRKTEKHPKNVTGGVDEAENITGDKDVPANIVTEYIHEASLLNNVGTELSFRLPLEESKNFPPMLEKLDSEIKKGTINSYGLSITTLDEVFQIIARNEGIKCDQLKSSLQKKTIENKNVEVESDSQSTSSSKSTRKNLKRNKLFTTHLSALLRKRKSYYFRDKKAWCCTTVVPSLFVLLGFILLKTRSGRQDLIPIQLRMEDYNSDLKRNPIPYNTPDSNFTCQPGVCTYGNEVIQIINLNQSETASIMKNETYYFCGANAKLSAPDVASLLERAMEGQEEALVKPESCSIENSSNFLFRITDGGAFPVPQDASNLNETSYSTSNSARFFAETQYGAIYFTHEPDSTLVNEDSPFGNLSYSNAVHGTCLGNQGDYVRAEYQCDKYKGIGYVINYNFSALHATPMYQAIADEAIIREALNDDRIKISPIIHPLPITTREDEFGKAEDAFVVWFLIVLSFPFIGGAFATFVVTERQSKAKHLQTVAGVKPIAYWTSTFLWDLINYQSPLWISIILAFAFDVEILITKDRGVLGAVISLLFMYGPASACFAYTLSFAFSSPSLCNVVLIVSGFLFGFGGPIAVFIMRLVSLDPLNPNEKLKLASKITEWVLRIIPSFCLGNGLYKAINIEFFDFIEGKRVEAWDSNIVGLEVVFLSLQTVVYFLLAIILDMLNSNPRAVSIWRILTCRLRGLCSNIPTSSTAIEDDDVLSEEQRILSGGANNDMIVLSHLTKVYDTGKIAINNLSLGIPPGQCFGLLGINGAGKTTTMGILTAEFPPTSGDATLASYSVVHQPEKTRRRIGYCPQFDAHFENLTGREHIELYASIKGVPTEYVKMSAAEKLAEVGLCDEDADRISSQYSGGMKRRLSLACATIGQPEIVFLDECTTGVDPVARREIWQLISDMVTEGETPEERTSVILTTHSMEECEALCPRIGIMANGRLRCLGSAQHLKSKFGRGYQIEMTVKALTKDGDYSNNYLLLTRTKENSTNDNCDDEDKAKLPDNTHNTCFNLEEATKSLDALTGDKSLSKKIHAKDETGYLIYNEATSDVGVDIDELASFATMELRMRNVDEYISTTYPNSTKRERQDLRVRYEISSEDTRISEIFAGIERTKESLQLADYGVSQTSLEQVFNMHADEAERLKYLNVDKPEKKYDLPINLSL